MPKLSLEERLKRLVPPGTMRSVRSLAKTLRVKQDVVVDIAENEPDFTVNVAYGIPGVGYANLPKGDWTVENMN